jgi:hypothetical protein
MSTATADILVQLPEPHAAQQRVIREAARFNVLECGRRFGKSTLGLNLAVETAIDGGPAGWFAPTYKTMVEQWVECERIVAPLVVRANRTEGQMRLLTGGLIDFWSLDNPDSGRGRRYKRIVIDEASIIRDLQQAWQQTIRPTLTDLRGDAWFLGTPKGRNFFHQLFTKGETGELDWKSWRLSTLDNPWMPADEIAAARLELPEHVFRQEYEGVPADDGGNPFGLAAIRACIAPLSATAPVAFGVDLAKSVDWTVVIGLDAQGAVCLFERWQSPWDVTKTRIRSIVGGVPALVDATGVGDPVVEDLQRGIAGRYEGFKFTAPSKQQLMEGLSTAIQQREIRVPEGVIVAELEAFEYEYTRSGVRYQAPAGMHDDCVCALALAVMHWRQLARHGTTIRPLVM